MYGQGAAAWLQRADKAIKALSAPNTAYSASRAEHHLGPRSSLPSGATEDCVTVFAAQHCWQLAHSAQP